MRRLTSSVVAGGVVYPAGTAETDALAVLVTNDSLWADDSTAASVDDESIDRGVVEREGNGEQGEREAALQSELERVIAENEDLREQLAAATASQTPGDSEANPDDESNGPPQAPEDYSGYDVKSLKAEINLRNQGRETPIDIAEPGNKPELIAALTADDQARA